MFTRKFSLVLALFVLTGMTAVTSISTTSASPVRVDDIEGFETAMDLQRVFSTVAERVSPAVVVITNLQVQRRGDQLEDLPPAFRFFFGVPERERERGREREYEPDPRPAGRGSGVILRSNGYILTNYHVIRDHDELELQLHDGTQYSTREGELEVVGVDRDTDLAMLKIIGADGEEEDLDLPWLDFADTEKLRVGEWTIAVGAPFDFDYSVTVGVVSQKGRHGMRMHTFENYIQTDASINPGNSGGPLVNIKGEIIGINNFIIASGGMGARGNTGVGFAIDGSLAKQVAEQIIEQGEVIRPWLGISMQDLTPELQEQFGVDKGVLINEVMEGDPAEEAGLQAGDVVVRVGDEEVESPRDLQFAVLDYSPGDEIKLTIVRNGEEKTISVVAVRRGDEPLARYDDREEEPQEEDVFEVAGLELEEARGRVVISHVASGSPADSAELRRGDVIREVNRSPVTSVQEARQALEPSRGGTAVLYIERRGSRFFVPLRLD